MTYLIGLCKNSQLSTSVWYNVIHKVHRPFSFFFLISFGDTPLTLGKQETSKTTFLLALRNLVNMHKFLRN